MDNIRNLPNITSDERMQKEEALRKSMYDFMLYARRENKESLPDILWDVKHFFDAELFNVVKEENNG